MKKLVLGTIMLSSLAMAQNISAQKNLRATGGGNGGDSVANHFYDIGVRLSKVVSVICTKSTSLVCSSQSDLKEKILDEAKIYSNQRVLGFDGKERDAINNGIDSITVSRSRWEDMELSYTRHEKRVRLVLHEYLSLLGLESSDNYSLTTPFVQEIKSEMFDLAAISGRYIRSQVVAKKCSISLSSNFNRAKNKKLATKLIEKKGYKLYMDSSNVKYKFVIDAASGQTMSGGSYDSVVVDVFDSNGKKLNSYHSGADIGSNVFSEIRGWKSIIRSTIKQIPNCN